MNNDLQKVVKYNIISYFFYLIIACVIFGILPSKLVNYSPIEILLIISATFLLIIIAFHSAISMLSPKYKCSLDNTYHEFLQNNYYTMLYRSMIYFAYTNAIYMLVISYVILCINILSKEFNIPLHIDFIVSIILGSILWLILVINDYKLFKSVYADLDSDSD